MTLDQRPKSGHLFAARASPEAEEVEHGDLAACVREGDRLTVDGLAIEVRRQPRRDRLGRNRRKNHVITIGHND